MQDTDFTRQLDGWSLTTAEITYRMPDYRHLLQSFIWQDYDIAPHFPRLIKFLDFWAHNLDGPLAEVRVHGPRAFRRAVSSPTCSPTTCATTSPSG